ncbi:helix-turn-helix transcriptional regulator [Nocardioides sp. W7]|uniref:helix-turn-helix domain-containing protein n=1 Tax=Nocardioides sp. W7 TaxID=2931390 RepID=UPI001FD481E1|nr:helix-turn-helix transcriptional regulator [Nocardioides sp. W7]
MTESAQQAGEMIRGWRRRRHLSQLELAHRAGVSGRHLSFVETGRSQPTPAMILRLCDQLAVPLREQNRVLLAGGFAPAHPELDLADPPMTDVAAAIEGILSAHLPFPALVVDPGWDLVSANDAIYALLDGVAPQLLEPPVNVIRLTLAPDGLAPRIVNLDEWREHLLARLAHEHDLSGDPRLVALLEELGPAGTAASRSPGLVVPLRLRGDGGELAFLSTTTVFGTPREVTLSELAIEAFYPADAATRAALVADGG